MTWLSDIPPLIPAGTTLKWRDSSTVVPIDQIATSTDWTLTYYLRGSVSGAHIVVGNPYNSGWEFIISATDTATFTPGKWSFEARVSKGEDKHRVGLGEVEVQQSLVYSGTAGAIETRTKNEIERDLVDAALKKFYIDGVQEYSIGNRTFKRVQMNDLRVRLAELKSACNLEKAAQMQAQGLGRPDSMGVRF